MDLSERQKNILSAVVEEYIATAEPVGSKKVATKAKLKVSSATVRNELVELTNRGYLQQPHTSAGRIPTAKGYRIYVNELMGEHELSPQETEEIRRILSSGQQTLRNPNDAGKLAADMTNLPVLTLTTRPTLSIRRFDLIYIDANTFILVVLLSDNQVKNKLMHLPFSVEREMVTKLATVFNANFTGLTEDQITATQISAAERATGDTMGLVAAIAGFAIETLNACLGVEASLTGGAKLLQLPEFRDPDKAHRLMNYLSESDHLSNLSNLSGDAASTSFGDGIQMMIGPENVAEELRDSSVILARFNAGDGLQGVIGVVGPTRMDYSHVAAKLGYIANMLSQMLAQGGGELLPGFGKLMIPDQFTQPVIDPPQAAAGD